MPWNIRIVKYNEHSYKQAALTMFPFKTFFDCPVYLYASTNVKYKVFKIKTVESCLLETQTLANKPLQASLGNAFRITSVCLFRMKNHPLTANISAFFIWLQNFYFEKQKSWLRKQPDLNACGTDWDGLGTNRVVVLDWKGSLKAKNMDFHWGLSISIRLCVFYLLCFIAPLEIFTANIFLEHFAIKMTEMVNKLNYW